MARARSTAPGDPLPRPRVSLFVTSTLLLALALVFALDPDDDDDDDAPVLPVATASAPGAEAEAKPGTLRRAKDARLRPRKTALRKRARIRHHLHESGPPVPSSQRPRRGINVSPHLCLPECRTRLAALDPAASGTVFTPVLAPLPPLGPPPRLTRAPPVA